jgi:hypothetical protein
MIGEVIDCGRSLRPSTVTVYEVTGVDTRTEVVTKEREWDAVSSQKEPPKRCGPRSWIWQ